MIYGTKRSFSTGSDPKANIITKKSSSYTRLDTAPEVQSFGIDKQTLKYVKPKEILKNLTYNKSAELIGYKKETKVEETTTDSRKDPLKDPTRLTYISKTVYNPQYNPPARQFSGVNQSYGPSKVTHKPVQSNSYACTNTSTSTSTKLGNYGSPKFGNSYTASSAYTN